MTLLKRNLTLNGFKRYLSLKTHKIYALPIVILMPHSGCNCRCVMCDIWQNTDKQSLSLSDVQQLISNLRQLETQWVVMSGGEALMNPRLFELCDVLRAEGMKVTILSTGLLLKRYASQVAHHSDEVIVSLDGSPEVHNAIRRIPRAFQKLAEGVAAVKAENPAFPIGGRCVIQRQNFRDWPNIIATAKELGLDEISFLAADVSSPAFNRPEPWAESQSEDVRLSRAELPALEAVLEHLLETYTAEFESGYIAESPTKLWRVYQYYAALQGLGPFPQVSCNAPWVSAVIEADGTVRPCFFHETLGNIHQTELAAQLNSPKALAFRRNLNLQEDPICQKCVCSLNLRPSVRLV